MRIKLNIINKSRDEDASTMEVALINDTRKVIGGQASVISIVDELYGGQFGYICHVKKKLMGMQISTGISGAKELIGMQISVLISGVEKLIGFQGSLFYNVCGEDSYGMQVGLINHRLGGNWYSRFVPFIAIRTGKRTK